MTMLEWAFQSCRAEMLRVEPNHIRASDLCQRWFARIARPLANAEHY